MKGFVRRTLGCMRFIDIQNPDDVKSREVEPQRQSMINRQKVSFKGRRRIDFFFYEQKMKR